MPLRNVLIVISFLVVGSAARGAERESFFALNGVGYFHYRDEPDAAVRAKQRLDLLNRAGARGDRFDFWWGEIEPQRGQWKFDKSDWLIDFYQQHRVQMLPILCYRANWMNDPPRAEQDFGDFANYVEKVVRRYKSRVKCWEIWNEPNIPTFWKPPSPKDYARLLIAAHAAAKRADPNCTVVGFSANETDINWILDVGAAGASKSFDVASFHSYSMSDGPEEMHLHRQIQLMRKALAKIGRPDAPMWITEMGWQADSKKPDELRQQARYMVQSHVIALAEGVERLFWFNLQDWREGEKTEAWGLVSPEGKVKPTLAVYRNMVDRLEGAKFVGYCPVVNGVGYAFERNGKTLLVQWRHRDGAGPGAGAGISIPETSIAPADVTDIRGAKVRVSEARTYDLSVDPVYVEYKLKVQLPMLMAALPEPVNYIANGSMEEGSAKDVYGWGKGVFYGGNDKGNFIIADESATAGHRSIGFKGAEDALWESFPVPAFPGERFNRHGAREVERRKR
jgi:hypothetical protein